MLRLLNGPHLKRLLPEVAALQGVQQPPEYHSEGDALEHTRLAVAALPADADERLVWATALHDTGKAATTRRLNGRLQAHGHDKVSEQMVADILPRFDRAGLVQDVAWLVRHHHFALSWQTDERACLTGRQRRFCAHPLFPLLVALCRADAAASLGCSDKLARLERILRALETQKER